MRMNMMSGGRWAQTRLEKNQSINDRVIKSTRDEDQIYKSGWGDIKLTSFV